jgi:hypothetical protein
MTVGFASVIVDAKASVIVGFASETVDFANESVDFVLGGLFCISVCL